MNKQERDLLYTIYCDVKASMITMALMYEVIDRLNHTLPEEDRVNLEKRRKDLEAGLLNSENSITTSEAFFGAVQ